MCGATAMVLQDVFLCVFVEPPKPWKIKVFWPPNTRLLTTKTSKHVGFGGPMVFVDECFRYLRAAML